MWQVRFKTVDRDGCQATEDAYCTTRQEARDYVAMRRRDGWPISDVTIENQTIDHFAGTTR